MAPTVPKEGGGGVSEAVRLQRGRWPVARSWRCC